jgi:predicted XRE-type DNA-binding protein
MKRSAEREMRACRRAWNLGDVEGDWIGEVVPSKGRKRTIAERIKPYIGTGMKQREVAEILGCTRGPIVKALKKLGARL